ncbi:hypothetical protein CPB86DRAFT_794133 [Serendipita vermifera]|nr:hypothetical protein CPB86DRAFT_794133 [Serendipita vermifera]
MQPYVHRFLTQVSSPIGPEFTSPVDPRESNDRLNTHKCAKELSDNPTSASTENSLRPRQQHSATNGGSHSQQHHRFTGYLHRGKRRELNELTGEWEVKDENEAPSTGYKDRKTFPDDKSKVFVVTYFPNGEQDTVWRNPTSDHKAIKEYLEPEEKSPDRWRWVHCEGLHGETLQLIAQETMWPVEEFLRIFSRSRGSAEYIKGDLHDPERLYLHFIDQSTRLYVLFARTGPCPNPRKQLMSKILGYANRGDSRASLRLPEDPSLMIYGIFRAIIQDLRHSAHYLHFLTEKAYLKATSESSQNKKLTYFLVYGLLSRLLVIKLNTAALKNTNVNLKILIDAMHDDKSTDIPLISKNAQYMIKDQMGLVDLLAEEIPAFIRQAEAISNLAFNTLTASNNRFLKVITAVTTLLLPLSLVIGLLSMKPLSDNVENHQLNIILGTISGAIVFCLLIFFLWPYLLHSGRDKILDEEESVDGNHLLMSAFQDLENSNRVERLSRFRDKVYDVEPDQFSPHPLGSPLR